VCTGAQNQRLPFPLLSDAGELLRKNFDIKARDAPRFCWHSQHRLVSWSGSASCGCIVIAP